MFHLSLHMCAHKDDPECILCNQDPGDDHFMCEIGHVCDQQWGSGLSAVKHSKILYGLGGWPGSALLQMPC